MVNDDFDELEDDFDELEDFFNDKQRGLKGGLDDDQMARNKKSRQDEFERRQFARKQEEQNKIQPPLSPELLKREKKRKAKLKKLQAELHERCKRMSSEGLRAYEEYATSMGDILALSRLLAEVLHEKYKLNPTDMSIAAINGLLDAKDGLGSLFGELSDYYSAASQGDVPMPAGNENALDILGPVVNDGELSFNWNDDKIDECFNKATCFESDKAREKAKARFKESSSDAVGILLMSAGYRSTPNEDDSEDDSKSWIKKGEGLPPVKLSEGEVKAIIGKGTTCSKLFDKALNAGFPGLVENLNNLRDIKFEKGQDDKNEHRSDDHSTTLGFN